MPEASGASNLGQIDSTSLRERARESIRASIITGEISPGEFYPVGYFVARLGVSATPIREALIDLANEGLIVAVRNRGFRVPELSLDDLEELFAIRVMLEVPAVAMVAVVAGKEDVAQCRRHALQIRECAQRHDLVGTMEADRAFHLTLLQILGNDRLVRIVARLRDETRLYGLRYLAEAGQLKASAAEHHEILEAVAKQNSARAAELMQHHLESTRDMVRRSFR
jgi:DNA-binding GntR family transcriptional regulator